MKMECEKLAQEKTEMQRHYVMVRAHTTIAFSPSAFWPIALFFLSIQYYEMSYGLNVEMHKQTEIGKRLDAIIRQVLPFLSAEHQTQVAMAVERAKQITMAELNAAMQVRYIRESAVLLLFFPSRAKWRGEGNGSRREGGIGNGGEPAQMSCYINGGAEGGEGGRRGKRSRKGGIGVMFWERGVETRRERGVPCYDIEAAGRKWRGKLPFFSRVLCSHFLRERGDVG